ncbi:MAG: 50S ribosomal protein L31e [Candidatus Micrarchaeota archaeon]|nr:50S ribosomal protein L31e [Candidatus Micrarchaeota archaeon]
MGATYDKTSVRRARNAVKMVRSFLCRHMKAEESTVRISEKTNELLFARGMQKPPRKLKVRVVRADGIVKAYLMDEKPVEKKEAKKEGKKEEKPKEAPKEEHKKEAAKEKEEKKPAAGSNKPEAAKEAPEKEHTHEKKG